MKFPIDKANRRSRRQCSILTLVFASIFVIADLRLSVATCSDTNEESPGTARSKISEGMQFFSEGKFTEAAEQFATAVKKSKERSAESAVALFDQACALRAAGELEKARELLLEVAISRDQKLASSAHYNLAAISAEEGRKSLGEDPMAVSDAKEREKAIERFSAAVSHYCDSLQSDSNGEDARHNLELLRMCIKELEQGWRDRDLQAQRDKQDLFQFLSSLDKQQSELREQTRQLANRQPRASRLERTKLAELQRKMLDELGPLSAKVDQNLQPPQAQAGQSGSQPQPAELSDEEKAAIQQIRQVIGEVNQKAQESIASSVENIGSGKFDEATKLQQDTCDRFYETYALMAPFQQVLQRAIEDQQALIERSNSIIGESSQDKKKDASTTKFIDADWLNLSWRQSWLTKLNSAMKSKAAGMLKQLPPEDNGEDRVKLDKGSDEASGENQQKKEDPKENIPEAGGLKDKPDVTDNEGPSDEELMAALRRAVEKALENSPAIAEHSKSASSQLKESRASEAKPEQEEVLRLLKEIADLLPKQPPQDQQQNNQDEQNKENKEQKQDDQQKQDQQKQDQQQQDKSKDPKSDQQQSDKQDSKGKQDKSDPNQSQKEQPKPDEKDKEGNSQSDKDKKKENNKEKGQSEQQKQSDEKKEDESNQAKEAQQESASESSDKPDEKAQKQKVAQERAQVILRRIREREASYRELLEQLREAQGRRSPVEKDW